MKTTINERIMLLKTHFGLSTLEFCHKANISNGTLFNVQRGENVSEKTVRTICDALNVNREWLSEGTGPMFIEKASVAEEVEGGTVREALGLLRDQLKRKDEQIAALLGMLGGKVNFPDPSKKNGSAKVIEMKDKEAESSKEAA